MLLLRRVVWRPAGRGARLPAMCYWQRWAASRRICSHQLAPPIRIGATKVRTLASYQRAATDATVDQRPGLVRRGLTAFFVISGVLLWGTTLLEYVMLESTLPEELEELLRAEEKEEEKVAKFYGLEAMSKDPSIADDQYFDALDERKILLHALIKKLDVHPQMDKLLGNRREITYLANRDTRAQCGTTVADWQSSVQAETGADDTVVATEWAPRFHIQGASNDQMAVAQARFADNGRRTGELVPVSLKVEMLSTGGNILDITGPIPHGLKWIHFD